MSLFDFEKKKLNNQPKFNYYRPDPEIEHFASIYYRDCEKIEQLWSVIYNLKSFNSVESKQLMDLCYKSISDYKLWKSAAYRKGFGNTIPSNVPAYKRLVMLFEKQENYVFAINVCIDAMKNGAVRDDSKGGMPGRLSRLIKKANITPTSEMIYYMTQCR